MRAYDDRAYDDHRAAALDDLSATVEGLTDSDHQRLSAMINAMLAQAAAQHEMAVMLEHLYETIQRGAVRSVLDRFLDEPIGSNAKQGTDPA